jgi:translation initiation factor 2 alpha subunit (eIF-2alpha)
MAELEQGDVVLCTVEKINGTIVFVNIDDLNKQGSIILSEIAPGRIRNLRDYVVPKKKIVCKVLRVTDRGDLHLSLRRVTQKEQKQVLEQFKQEKSYTSILKSILKEKTEEVTKKIRKEDTLFNFLEETKKDSKKLEKIIGKENTTKVLEILNKQKQKTTILKKEISLNSNSPNGLEEIKKILSNKKDSEIKYIAAGKYSIKVEDKDTKAAGQKIKSVLDEIEKSAKKENMNFSIKEK